MAARYGGFQRILVRSFANFQTIEISGIRQRAIRQLFFMVATGRNSIPPSRTSTAARQ